MGRIKEREINGYIQTAQQKERNQGMMAGWFPFLLQYHTTAGII